MDFVAACANIRCHVFGIPPKTRFDIKSMAGNIIPAIATTNAVIAGCIVMEAIKIIQGRPIEDCKMVFMARKPNPRYGQHYKHICLPFHNRAKRDTIIVSL